MYRIDKRYLGKDGHWTYVEEVVYTEDEAMKEGLKYVPWREATKTGQWAITDDGYVARVVEVKEYIEKRSKKTNKMIKLSIGVGFDNMRCDINFEKNHILNVYSAISPKTWEEKEIKRSRTKNFTYMLALMKMAGKIDWEALGKAYRPDSNIPAWTAKKLAKRTVIKTMVEEEIKKILDLQGITDDYTSNVLKEAVELGRKNKDANIMLKGVAMISKLRGWEEKEVRTETREIEGEQIERLEENIKSSQKLKLKQTTKEETK